MTSTNPVCPLPHLVLKHVFKDKPDFIINKQTEDYLMPGDSRTSQCPIPPRDSVSVPACATVSAEELQCVTISLNNGCCSWCLTINKPKMEILLLNCADQPSTQQGPQVYIPLWCHV